MTCLKGTYLFPEINRRKQQFLSANKNISLISLGIGDTTEPIPESIANQLMTSSQRLGTHNGYSGYGPEQGMQELRTKIASIFYNNRVPASDIFISDGAKCDLGRLQLLFGHSVSIAVQDPTYPVYVEGSIIAGVKEIILMPCTPDNQFFPDLQSIPRTDLIYFCSPNNPTGAAATKSQLANLVAMAKANRSIIIFDAAYSHYIQDESLPKSIYEIEGAKEVAIEINSFSKLAGFTGIRLGWSVVPTELKYEDGYSVRNDWMRLISTIFNGASNIAQQGGCAVLEENGLREVSALTKFYLDNTHFLRTALTETSHEVFGGVHAPYLWVRFKGQKSWDVFQSILEKHHIITTPGSGFGAAGEGFIRFSAFGSRQNILTAIQRLQLKV